MKKLLLFTLMALPLSMLAQNQEATPVPVAAVVTSSAPTFGYLSYSTMIETMPDYAFAHKQYLQLEEKYAAETKRVEDEFNAKYEAFLEGQRDFPPTILKKRQTELQELLEKNIAFKAESKRLLADAETTLMKPLREKLSKVLATIGEQMNLMFIINTDNDACPYINPKQGVDLTGIATRMINEL